ncbi:ATP-binding cassette domain-containing protein [Actinospica sp.]|uniref:ATP-binding cassette domain-containing protein n=1 Tax=Actinospica sp. TaxID=1872142 RepID=UPI0032C23E91
MAGESVAIDARDLVKTYKGGVRAVRGVSLRIPAGTVFGLLGPNGAGKSTIVKMLTTLSAPTDGTATVAGFDIVRQQKQVRRSIGCVAQNSGVDVQATGRENLLLQGRVYGMRGAELDRRADELLLRFGLAEVGKRFVKTYSGGMKRKLDVALGLMHSPRVLFLDEPTTGLAPEARAEMWEQIRELAWDQGLTILLTTHYLEEADQLARNLAIVDQGQIVTQGTPDELKSQLNGDAVSLELAAGTEADMAKSVALQQGSLLTDVVVEGLTMRGRSADGAGAVPALLAALEAAEIHVASVTVARPSLDDVYLRYTGRSFSSADLEAAQ